MHTLQNQVKSKVRIKAQRQKLNCHFKKSSNRPICQARRLPRRPVSSNWPAATPTGHFLSGPSSGPSARHVLVRPEGAITGRTRRRSRPMTGPYRRLRTIDIAGGGMPKTAGRGYGGARPWKHNGHRPPGRRAWESPPSLSDVAGRSVDLVGGMGT